MTHIPPITREAREWLRDCLVRMGGSSEGDTAYQTGVRHTTEALRQKLYSMPTPTDPLDAIRARFQPKTRGGYEYEIFAERHGWLYGRYHDERGKPWPGKWAETSGRMAEYIDRDSHPYHLVLVSPHAALIAELRNVSGVYSSITADLLKRAADALEGDK